MKSKEYSQDDYLFNVLLQVSESKIDVENAHLLIIRFWQDEIDSMNDFRANIAKNDIKRRESIHDKLGMIRKCIANADIDEEVYEIVNNISKELQREICPWIKNT